VVAGQRGRYIVVEGPIGVGKTSLARRLAEEFGSSVLLEDAEGCPFLARFYADPERFALPTQLYFLLSRCRQQRKLAKQGVPRRGLVADYLLAKDRIFAELNLNDEELQLYDEISGLASLEPVRPDLVVYLEARPDILVRRLHKRARSYERRISRKYLEALIEAYRRFFHRFRLAPLLVVNCSEIDFVEQGSDLADLIREIRSVKQGVQHYIPLGSR